MQFEFFFQQASFKFNPHDSQRAEKKGIHLTEKKVERIKIEPFCHAINILIEL